MVKIVSLISLFFTLQLCARCQDLAWDRSVCGSPLQSLLCKQKPQNTTFPSVILLANFRKDVTLITVCYLRIMQFNPDQNQKRLKEYAS